MDQIPQKRYFRIGEVSRITGLEPHVIRYWETEFSQLKPLRAGSQQRLYSRADVQLIDQISRLLYVEKYTIAGAKKRIKAEPVEAAQAEKKPGPPVPTREQPLFMLDSEPEPVPGKEDLLTAIKAEIGRVIKVLS